MNTDSTYSNLSENLIGWLFLNSLICCMLGLMMSNLFSKAVLNLIDPPMALLVLK